MPAFRLLFFFRIAILFTTFSALGQPQAAPPKPQTARQAIIEMATKGSDSIPKHLTLEVQELLKSNKLGWGGFYGLGSMKPESGLQGFESGEVLFVYNDDAQHMKYEVHVDNDDLAGDEDTLSLSIHLFKDGKEQEDQWNLMSSHFTVAMKLQQNIWRVNKITVGAEFPLGDAKFIEKTFLKKTVGMSVLMPGTTFYTPLDTSSQTPPLDTANQAPPSMPPEQVVQMLAVAESAFARQHPDVGFTCSLPDLAAMSRMMGIDPQVNTGTYNGYRFALSGCEGRPAGSFQITGEPLVAKPGGKVFCTDATQNVRASDGHGATCLTSGEVQGAQAEDEGGLAGFTFHSSESKPK